MWSYGHRSCQRGLHGEVGLLKVKMETCTRSQINVFHLSS